MASDTNQPRGGDETRNTGAIPGRQPIAIEFGTQSESDEVTELFLGEGSAVPASRTAPKSKLISEPLSVWKIVGRPDDVHEDAPAASQPETFAQPQPSPATVIEAVVQGHLPIFAAAWVTQYARARAEELNRAVVLLRLRQGHVSVECIMPPGVPAVSIPPAVTIDAAIATARGMGARHWIVQTDEVREPELWSLTAVSRITILTGADEAALVACYRALKGIAQTADQQHGAEIHVAVMGVGPEKAASALERVTNAGEKFLARTITGSNPAARIGAGTASSLFRSAADTVDIPGVVEQLSAHPQTEDPAAVPPSPSRAATVQREMAAMRDLLMTAEPETHAVPPAAVAEMAEAPASEATEPQAPVRTRPSSLVDFLAGVDPIDVHCPAAAVDFGIDGEGRLHAIAHAEGEEGHAATQSQAVEDLLIASSWAVAHARLLLSTHSDLRLDAGTNRPLLHLMTSRPREARRLLDTEIRIHLVVKADPDQPWISMDLN